MKTRSICVLGLTRCLGTAWKHVCPIFIFVIISMTFQYGEVGTTPARSLPPTIFANYSASSLLQSSPSTSSPTPDEANNTPLQPDALARLSKVFGISRIPRREIHRSPPQYMQDLYASITDTGGLSRASGPYNSNVIRSFPDSGM